MNRRRFLTLTGVASVFGMLPWSASRGVNRLPTDKQKPLRTVERFKDGDWQAIPWPHLKKGTFFRLREPDGSVAEEGTRYEVCEALADAVYSPDYGYSVRADPVSFPRSG